MSSDNDRLNLLESLLSTPWLVMMYIKRNHFKNFSRFGAFILNINFSIFICFFAKASFCKTLKISRISYLKLFENNLHGFDTLDWRNFIHEFKAFESDFWKSGNLNLLQNHIIRKLPMKWIIPRLKSFRNLKTHQLILKWYFISYPNSQKT